MSDKLIEEFLSTVTGYIKRTPLFVEDEPTVTDKVDTDITGVSFENIEL